MAKLNILIVEDEFITALDLKTQLMMNGYWSFDIVGTGEEAVKFVSYHNYDLILMDISLKGDMDGIEAACKIREKKNIPLIYVSGNSDMLNSDRLKETNPDGILRKPVTEWRLLELVKSVLEINNKTEREILKN